MSLGPENRGRARPKRFGRVVIGRTILPVPDALSCLARSKCVMHTKLLHVMTSAKNYLIKKIFYLRLSCGSSGEGMSRHSNCTSSSSCSFCSFFPHSINAVFALPQKATHKSISRAHDTWLMSCRSKLFLCSKSVRRDQ